MIKGIEVGEKKGSVHGNKNDLSARFAVFLTGGTSNLGQEMTQCCRGLVFLTSSTKYQECLQSLYKPKMSLTYPDLPVRGNNTLN
jgi:hypothetical protein